MIVPHTPLFNDGLSLLTMSKEPAIQTFAAECAFEAFNKWIFPRTAGRDIQRMVVTNGIPRSFPDMFLGYKSGQAGGK